MRKAEMIRILVLASLMVLTIGGIPKARAASYPERPVEIIVGFPAGGVVDLVARTGADATKPFFPQPLVVNNKPGGAGVIGMAQVYQAKPDGYSLCLLTDTGLLVSTQLMGDLPFKGPNDFSLVIKMCILPEVFVVGPKVPWKTMKELLDYAKANPGKIRVGHSGIGSTGHLHMADLAYEAKVQFTDVPYSGAAPSITAVIGGHVDASVLAVQPAILGNVKAGQMKILATWNAKRLAELPDVPTLKEMGYNTMTQGSYYFLGGPKGMPSQVVDTLYDAFKKGMQTDSYQKFAKDNIYILDYKGKSDLGKELEDTYKFYSVALKKWGLK